MLQFMRQHAKFFYVFLFLIIISFIFFYVGPMDEGNSPIIVEVGEKKIYMDEYWKAYENIREYYREIYKDKFDAEIEKTLNLKEIAINRIVTNELLLAASSRLGIAVSDDEIQESIINEPTFQRNGSFRKDIYLRVLEFNRMTPQFFETQRRQDLMTQKVRRLLALASESDVEMPENIGDDNESYDIIKQSIIMNQRERLIRAYISGLRKQITVKIHYELIA